MNTSVSGFSVFTVKYSTVALFNRIHFISSVKLFYPSTGDFYVFVFCFRFVQNFDSTPVRKFDEIN